MIGSFNIQEVKQLKKILKNCQQKCQHFGIEHRPVKLRKIAGITANKIRKIQFNLTC